MESALSHRRRLFGSTCLLGLWLTAAVLGQAPAAGAPEDVVETLARATARVEEYFTRAQSLVCTETVHVQPLSSGLTGDGFGRTVESELRLSWDPGIGGEPAGEARTRRTVVKVNGQAPRENDRNNCTGPEQHETEPQPLSMLLAKERDAYRFSWAGRGRIDRRDAVMIDFREIAELRVTDVREADDNEDCISYSVTGGMRGRIWIDAETSDVLRLDQRLGGQVEVPLPKKAARRPGASPSWTIERFDTTMRFKRVTFAEPLEVLVLPVSSTRMNVTRGAGTPRTRTTTTYSGYKRFLTGGRLVPGAPAPQ